MFDTRMTPKLFLDRVLNGAAIGIVVGLVPNAITGELFKFLARTYPGIGLFSTLHEVVVGLQFTVPVIVGVLIGMQFSFTAVQTVIVGTATFVGSGAMQFTSDGVVKLVGIGDLINTMLTASVAVLILALVGNRLGSLTVLFLPIIGGGLSGLIGLLTLPYVRSITGAIGALVNAIAKDSNLGVFAAVLIAVIFAIMIVSPISTVGVALAIGIDGPASGAANLGIAAAAAMLMVGSLRINSAGVTWSVFLGAMKMMMGNLIKHPIMVLPLALVAGVTGLVGGLVGITGTPASAGFGHSGLVGPIAALQGMHGSVLANMGILVVVYFVVPIGLAVLVHWLLAYRTGVYAPSIFAFSAQAAPAPKQDAAPKQDSATNHGDKVDSPSAPVSDTETDKPAATSSDASGLDDERAGS
ncbi:PTS transporter subunit IIC [Devriesea agamarum]|uniref:PTS transporter subunit IIC n=1 Tax=Devriesea agamarum TaxID=472569 RepID=UPI000A6B1B29|nr:PTS sugar transporter subunit IIC [Devriesea agamarum]